ncbi:MAG: hypothetical protein ACI8QZ_002422 [Chlamydiales bacterium]|jgi:hypothetical protein
MNCPDYETLAHAAFAEQVPQATADHLQQGCSTCDKRWTLLLQMREALVAGELAAVPKHLQRAAQQLGSTTQSRPPSLLSALKVLVAELIPPPSQSLMPAVRRSSAREVRKLYRAGSCDIDLVLTPERKLMGQIVMDSDMAFEDAWCSISPGSEGKPEDRVALRDTGEFAFDRIAPGPISLTFEWGDTRVLVHDVELSG